MSEMTLEKTRELVYGIRTNIESTKKGLPDDYQDWAEEVVSDLTHAIDSLAHLTRAPVQVTDEDVERAIEAFENCRGTGEKGMRAALESLSARLAQPVAVNGLTPDLFGEWCNTLTHAHMYVNERSLENAKHGIKLVLDDLREWQEKLSQPHPQAAQGGDAHMNASDVIVCRIGDYAPCDRREWATVIYDDKKVAECYTNEDAELIGAALRAYTHPAERAQVEHPFDAYYKQHPSSCTLTAERAAVPEDTALLDWLSTQCVEVRTPARYGSRANFVTSPEDDDGLERPNELRKLARESMLSAAPTLAGKDAST